MLDQSYYSKTDEIIEHYGKDARSLIPIMQDIQAEYRYLPGELLTYVAEQIGITEAKAYSVATFYENFSFEAKGKYVIKVCDGTACHVRKSMPVLEALWKELGLSKKKHTTDDMMFTVETVSCLGACGLAPTMMVNEDVHPSMTPEKALAVVEELRGRGETMMTRGELQQGREDARRQIEGFNCRSLVCSGTGWIVSSSPKNF